MKHLTREELWARQNLTAKDMDYGIWERDKTLLLQAAKLTTSCTFVVDVYKERYVFASRNFADLLGYDSSKIETLEKQGDYLESRFHPDDRARLENLQIQLGQFIYSLPAERRNDYCNLYSFRVRNARQQYTRVTSRQQVLETARTGKAWLIIGNVDISPDQSDSGQVDCTVLNLRNGETFSPTRLPSSPVNLTPRETEILQLIRQGLLGKEIAAKLHVSIHTVNVHRQNLLHKLGVQNSIEAINKALELRLLR